MEFLLDEHFQHPILTELAAQPTGFRELQSKPGGIALDYIRGNLFDRNNFVPLPITAMPRRRWMARGPRSSPATACTTST